MTNMERRLATRMMCAELVELDWKDKGSRRHRCVGNLEDISLAGACVQLERAVPVGTNMALHYGGGALHGAVQYCIYRDQSYFVGVEFKESSRWSPEQFRPEHMLDPRELTARPSKRPRMV